MIEDIQNEGFGKDIPPCRSHVVAWFVQMGQSEKAALAFYDCYDKNGWCNRAGKIIKNWKMTAWYWIWNKI